MKDLTDQNEAIKILDALNKSYAKKNLIDFTLYTFNKYKANWHHLLIADRLEMLAKGEIKRLVINMPPRHGKSELVSVRFPAWYLGNYPLKSIIATSYNAGLASEFGKKARNVVASLEFKELFKKAKLSEESAAKLNWTLEDNFNNKPCPVCHDVNWSKRAFGRSTCKTCGSIGEFPGSRTLGTYFGSGIGGGITGKGADVLIIDDPVKDRKEAQSETMRKNVWEWFSSAAYMRLEQSDSICLCQTRWHEDDLTGQCLNKVTDINEKWHVLSLKAIADDNEEYEIYNPDYINFLNTNIIKRKRGEPLWEYKYPIKKLNQIKNTVGSFEFQAQYQQHPQPDGGGLFKKENFRYCENLNDIYILKNNNEVKNVNVNNCIRFTTADLASRVNNTSDFTVICTWDLTRDNDLILIDMFRKRIEGAEHINIIWNIYNRLKPKEINIESTAYQITLIQTALKQGLPVKELRADKDKISRALPAAAKFESHKVFILKNIPDVTDIELELTQFPNGKNDDIVDNFGYAVARALEMKQLVYIPMNKNNFQGISDKKKFYEQLK